MLACYSHCVGFHTLPELAKVADVCLPTIVTVMDNGASLQYTCGMSWTLIQINVPNSLCELPYEQMEYVYIKLFLHKTDQLPVICLSTTNNIFKFLQRLPKASSFVGLSIWQYWCTEDKQKVQESRLVKTFLKDNAKQCPKQLVQVTA